MMKKAMKLILTAIFAMTLCLSLFMAVNTQTAKADGETYTLAFETGTPSADCAAWTAGWWSGTGGNKGQTADGTCSTVIFAEANTVYYLNTGNFSSKSGKTYKLTIEAKSSKDEWYHLYQLSDENVIIKTDNHAGTDWIKVETVFTAIKDDTIIFIHESTGATVQFRNMIITEVETKTLTAGAAIGTLPEVPAKEGYRGYWTLDGKEITAETLYNYGADKIAKPAYKENTFKLTFEQDFVDLSKSLQGWWSESGANNGHTADENGSEIAFKDAGKAVYNNFCETVVGNTYRLSVSYKKVSGDAKFHISHTRGNPGDGWNLLKDWIAATDDWQTYSATFTADGTHEVIVFQEPKEANDSVILFKDMFLTKIVSTTENLKKGDLIGELPAVPQKTGYTGYWTIDDKKITAETVYNYEESKPAKLVYEANEYTLTLGETEIKVTYGVAIGTLPAVPERKGYAGYWTVNDVVITAETVYYETEDVTAAIKYEANKYKLTLGENEKEVTYGEEIGALPAIGTEARKGYEYAWFIGETRLNEETVWEYAENKTATAAETLIQYKIEFKIGDTLVKTVYYTVETEEVEEPAIIPREGYTAKWEDYTLDGGDKVVNAVYTKIETPDSSSSSGSETSDGSSSSGGETSDGGSGNSCAGGINGLPIFGIILMAAVVVAIIRRKKNA